MTGLPLYLPAPEQARAELRRFFARLGVVEGPPLERLVERVVRRWRSLPGVAPLSVAGWLLATWMDRALARAPGQELGAAAAQAAVLLTGAGQRWPDRLLADEPLPDELAGVLRAALPQPVPRSLPLAMPAQSLAPAAFGLPRLAALGFGVEQRS